MTHGLADLLRPADAGSLLDLFPDRPRVLALGEPTHRSPELLALRNDVFRELVEHHGYRTIALETDCLRGLLVDEHVTTGAGALEDVVAAGLSHDWGSLSGNRDLVAWMRAFNADRPAHDQVRFAGFDGPLEIEAAASPRAALAGLHAYLAAHVDAALLPCTADALDRLVGPDERWTEPAAMFDPARSVGRSAQARELRLVADDLAALLDAQGPGLVRATGREAWETAGLRARTATGLLRYHFWTAEPSEARMPWLLRVRDTMMAQNLLALAERAPVLVNAHTSHLRRGASHLTMWGHDRLEWWGAGAQVSARLGTGYGTRYGTGYGYAAVAVGTVANQGVQAPPADTVEGALYTLPSSDRSVVDARRLADALGGVVPRESSWFGYAPLDAGHLAEADGIVFVRDVTAG